MLKVLLCRARLARLAVLLGLLIMTAGCGDSGEGAVYTGTTNGAQTGSVTFNFIKAQSPLQVPQSTTDIRFEFFLGPDGSGQPSQPAAMREFAPSITISPVLDTTRSIVVTALSPDGVPLLEAVANLTVTAGNNLTVDFANARVRTVSLASLQVSPQTASVEVEQTRQFQASATYSNGDTIPPVAVVWSSNPSSVATVDPSSGLARGVDRGSATITATIGSVSDSATLTVTEAPVLSSVVVLPNGNFVSEGAPIAFTAQGFDQFGEPFTLAAGSVAWSSSDPQVASINASTGVALGVSEGNTTVTATVEEISASASLFVLDVPGTISGIVSVSPDPLRLDLDPGDDVATLATTVSYSNGPDAEITNAEGLTYIVTGNPGVANVTNDGTVTAIARGSTTVTAYAGSFSFPVQIVVDFGTAGNQPPQIALDPAAAGELVVNQDTPVSAFPGATVSDPSQASFVGGVLTISQDGNQTADMILSAPESPDIGDLGTSNGTQTLVVQMSAQATPASVQEFLRQVKVSSRSEGGKLGDGTLQVLLTDGLGLQDADSRPFTVIGVAGRLYTVNPSLPVEDKNFHTLSAAVNDLQINGGNVSAGSAITIVNGTFDANVTIADDPDLESLRLRGPNAGVSAAGVGGPNPARGSEAIFQQLVVNAPGVSVDGLSLTVGTNGGIALFYNLDRGSVSVKNCVFTAPEVDTFEIGLRVRGVSSLSIEAEGNYFRGWYTGLALNTTTAGYAPFQGVTVVGNSFEANHQVGAELLYGGAGYVVSGNRFANQQGNHLYAELDDNGSVTITGNDFVGTGTVAMGTDTSGTLNAPNNFWTPAVQTETFGAGASTINTAPTSPAPNTNFPAAGP
jgi:uncharacterized protein YjdB